MELQEILEETCDFGWVEARKPIHDALMEIMGEDIPEDVESWWNSAGQHRTVGDTTFSMSPDDFKAMRKYVNMTKAELRKVISDWSGV